VISLHTESDSEIGTEQDIDGYLIRIDDLNLDEVLWSQDSVLVDAVRRVVSTSIADPASAITAFANRI
jgi:hypothetical protein